MDTVPVAARVGCATASVMANDHVRIPGDDLAGEIRKLLGPPLAGTPLDGEALSFDIAQPAQLFENRLIEARSHITN